MRIKTYVFLLVFNLLSLQTILVNAQFVNNGNTVTIQNGATLSVTGDFNNISGSIANSGTINLTGNWLNSDVAGAFGNLSLGSINFLGADQTIGGSQKTIFPNVNFAGTGVKTLLINTDVKGTLNLNDREIALEDKTLEVLNTDINAISYTTGFISTNSKGLLYRNTNTSSQYIYPLGSLISGSFIYRPVTVQTKDNLNNSIGLSFIDKSPDSQGYPVTQKRFDINQVNPLFFHIIDQKSGTSFADYNFYYNVPEDGNYNQIVNWIDFNLWEKAGIANPQPFTGGQTQLNQLITFSSLKKINMLPMALASTIATNDPITFFNGFSPDGDGKNDKWLIKNIDLFPDNELTIVNRWGSEVFHVKGYTNANAWDGLGLNNGTYFYILKVVVNSEPKVYKGFITLLKNE